MLGLFNLMGSNAATEELRVKQQEYRRRMAMMESFGYELPCLIWNGVKIKMDGLKIGLPKEDMKGRLGWHRED